jgi:hypothetical protein
MILSVPVLSAAVQGSPSDTHWTEEGEGYSISVQYPEIAMAYETLDNRLKETASEKMTVFMEFYDWYYHEQPYPTQWYLEIDFTHEPSPEGMICVMASVWEFTGGAHGNTWIRAFIYDIDADAFIGPVKLLGRQAGFEIFAEEVMEKLYELLESGDEWIEYGASAEPENYRSLVPVPDEEGGIAGYSVVFPPYQVAPYDRGTIEVYVPKE